MDYYKKNFIYTLIIDSVFSFLILVFCLFVLFNNNIANAFGSLFFKVINRTIFDYPFIYGKILGFSLLLCLPSILLPAGFVCLSSISNEKTKKTLSRMCFVLYVLISFAGIVFFYSASKDYYAFIPMVEPEGNFYSLFKVVIAFFDNIANKYLWYVFPVLFPFVFLVVNLFILFLGNKFEKGYFFVSIISWIIRLALLFGLVIGLLLLTLLIGIAVVFILGFMVIGFLLIVIAAGAPKARGRISINGESADFTIY